MRFDSTNRFLSTVARRLRVGRPLGQVTQYGHFFERTTYHGEPYLLPLAWFVTRGCSNDLAGGCTMCNFGTSDIIDGDAMVWQVERILEQFGHLPMFYITPLGSMFDDAEVPPTARGRILRLVQRTGCSIFGTESRAETITDEKMARFRDIFGPNVILQIGVGLESADDYIRRNCVNKRMSIAEYLKAIEIMHKYDIEVMVHVLHKSPFLTEQEAIDDTRLTIDWAFANGADRVIYFMTNLKPFTLTSWLAKHGRYRVPYIWSGVRVLSQLPPDQANRITLSGVYSGIQIEQLAFNCAECSERFIGQLQKYSMTLHDTILYSLINDPCNCRIVWESALLPEKEPLPTRLALEYAFIGEKLFGMQWWQANSEWVLAEIETANVQRWPLPIKQSLQENSIQLDLLNVL